MKKHPILQILLGEFHDKMERLSDLVVREAKFPDAPSKIKVAIGMRRAGKTYFLYQQILKLLASDIAKETILYLNFGDYRLSENRLAGLVDAFYELYPENHDRKCYLFFDEIQNVPNWPTIIRRLHDSKNAEIYLTGSSAKLLSKEISTNLRGRSLAVEIWPYSFNEFLTAKKITIDRSLYDKKTQDKLTQHFNHYLSEGGFPEITWFEPDIQQRTLQDYLDVVAYRDIIERHQIKNPSTVKAMILSMIHNIGRPFAVNKFYNDLKSRGLSISKDALYEYSDHIEDAYLIFQVPLFSESFRKSETSPKKLYAIDPGLIRALTLDYESDLGRLFENVIFLDLKRLGFKISTYLTSQRHEVDFLAEGARGEKRLFQVAWNIQDDKTLKREERALEAAKKELKIDGEIITLDSYLSSGGIRLTC